MKGRAWIQRGSYFFLALVLSVTISLGLSHTPSQARLSHPPAPATLVQQGRDYLQAGQYTRAIAPLQQAAQTYEEHHAPLNRALALSYLALTYHEGGDRAHAQEAIETSVALLPAHPNRDSEYHAHAHVFNTYGELLLSWGRPESAVNSWQTAASSYQQLEDQTGILGTEINQIQALRSLGHYRQAERRTARLETQLVTVPNSTVSLTAWRSLGNTQLAMGQHDMAHTSLEKSLAIAQDRQDAGAIAAAFLSLGNLERARGDRQLEYYLLSRQQPLARQSYCPTSSSKTWANQIQTQDGLNPYEHAIHYYQQAIATDGSFNQEIRAQLNRFSVMLALDPPAVLDNIPFLVSQLQALPSSRFSVYARVHFAQDLLCLAFNNPSIYSTLAPTIETLLNQGIDRAQELGDRRAESYSWGMLGYFYEQQHYGQQTEETALIIPQPLQDQAKQATDRAMALAQQIQAPDMTYRWQWQMGRLLRADGDRDEAIAYYTLAFENLKSLRANLTVLDSDIRFSFREQIEPLYRQFADLLLRSPHGPSSKSSPAATRKGSAVSRDGSSGDSELYQPSQSELKQAREVLESLQLAELDNFFQDACSRVKAESVDTIIDEQSRSSAVLYSIILEDRLDLILKLPSHQTPSNVESIGPSSDRSEDSLNLHYYSIPVRSEEIRDMVLDLRRQLTRPHTNRTLRGPAFTLYQWLIQPIEADLHAYDSDHIVFVLDGILRMIPMAALYDGQTVVGDRYAISLSPGLQLLEPTPSTRTSTTLLAAGLSESRDGFPALPGVEAELAQIADVIPTATQLLNNQFTESQVESTLNRNPVSIVHLATHGQFSSQAANTFLLAYDDKIQINELNELLRAQNRTASGTAIDLLVLSACQTASGDDRAALGLAGVALRAGARATLASLWAVDDQATTLLVSEFYRQLYNSGQPVSKVEALRRAQKSVRELEFQGIHPYEHPRYWAAFVLLGNWM